MASVLERIPIAKRKQVEAQLKATAVGGMEVRALYDSLVSELGITRLRALLLDLCAVLPKDKASKMMAIDAIAG